MEKKTFDEIYLHFGVYKDQLFRADNGFSAEAWQKSDELFNDIAAQSFMATTADDCKQRNIERYDIRRLESQEEFDKLLEKAHPAFKRLVDLWYLNEIVVDHMELDTRKRMRTKFNGTHKYSEIYGVHLFKNEDDLWTHEFAIFNDNESGLPNKVMEEFRDSLPTWDAVVELVGKISGYMNREDCEKQLNKSEEGLYVFEFYCN